MSADDGSEPRGDRPLLRIVRGDPTPEELAALVAVLAAASAGGQAAGRRGECPCLPVGSPAEADAPGCGAHRMVGVVATEVSCHATGLPR